LFEINSIKQVKSEYANSKTNKTLFSIVYLMF